MRVVYGYLFSYLYIIGILVVITIIKKISKSQHNDVYRKTVHILIPFTWIPLYGFLFGTWHFVIIPLSFVLITALSVKFGFIRIVERDIPIGKDLGIVHYSISMTILCIIAKTLPVYLIPCGIGIFALSFGDGAAAVFGQAVRKNNLYITKTKTLIGSIACFSFTIAGVLILRMLYPFNIEITTLLVIGIIATLMEIIGGRYDNYTVPIGTAIAAMLVRINEV